MHFVYIFAILIPFTVMATPTEPSVAWDKKEVSVCFGDDSHKYLSDAWNTSARCIDFTDDHKEWIKSIITQEYNPQDTGITFTGWQSCTPGLINADVVLLRSETSSANTADIYYEAGGFATTGQRGWRSTYVDENTKEEYEIFEKRHPVIHKKNVIVLSTNQALSKRVSAEKYIQMLALHEFGHTAGLGHQHMRQKAAKEDPNCFGYEELMKPEVPLRSTVFAGAYDYNSVMNYCFLNKITDSVGISFRTKNLDKVIKIPDMTLYSFVGSKDIFGRAVPGKFTYSIRIGLSALDKHALKCLYVYDEETRIKVCSASY